MENRVQRAVNMTEIAYLIIIWGHLQGTMSKVIHKVSQVFRLKDSLQIR